MNILLTSFVARFDCKSHKHVDVFLDPSVRPYNLNIINIALLRIHLVGVAGEIAPPQRGHK